MIMISVCHHYKIRKANSTEYMGAVSSKACKKD